MSLQAVNRIATKRLRVLVTFVLTGVVMRSGPTDESHTYRRCLFPKRPPGSRSLPPCKALLPILLLTTFLIGCREKQETPQAGPPEVEVTEVTQRNVPVYHEWVAQLNGRTNAQISPRVQGCLLVQNYRNGF